jgi:hypothetical protein
MHETRDDAQDAATSEADAAHATVRAAAAG